MSVPPACSGSGQLVVDAAAQEVTCPGCGHIVPVRTDRKIRRHQVKTNPLPSPDGWPKTTTGVSPGSEST